MRRCFKNSSGGAESPTKLFGGKMKEVYAPKNSTENLADPEYLIRIFNRPSYEHFHDGASYTLLNSFHWIS